MHQFDVWRHRNEVKSFKVKSWSCKLEIFETILKIWFKFLLKIINRLWRSSLLFPASFQLLLMKLILNFTSNCEKGLERISSSNFSSSISFLAIISLSSQNDKTSATYQLVQRVKKSSNPHLIINFQILINCSSLSEFRTLIWKVSLSTSHFSVSIFFVILGESASNLPFSCRSVLITS